VDRNEVIVHRDTAAAVDTLLRGLAPAGERREQGANGQVHIEEAFGEPHPTQPMAAARPPREGPARIFPYALSRDLLERVIRSLGLDARTVGNPEQADLVVALRARADDFRLHRVLDESGATLHLIKRNTANELRRLLQNVFHIMEGFDEDEVQDAVKETEEAIRQVCEEGRPVALAPRRPALRKMQHRIIAGRHLVAESEGKEPERHLVVHPPA
jgi:hypothetical protein